MKSRFIIAFMSFMLIATIVAPSVCALIDVELQTALVDSKEGEEKKEAKEKEVEEKKLISEIAMINDSKFDLSLHNNAGHELIKLYSLLREVPIPPPESQA